MDRGVDKVERAVPSANAVADLAKMAFGEIASHACNVVHAAHFLHGSGGDGEILSADTEQNDLFGARLVRFGRSGRIHHRTPTGVARVRAMTRFSMAA